MSQKPFADGLLVRGDKHLVNSPFDHFQRMEHLTDKIYEWSQRQRKAAEDALYETHGALSISIILVIVILFVGFVKLLKDSLRRCLMWGFPHRNENSTLSKLKHLIAVLHPPDNSWNLNAYFRYVTSRNAFCKTDGETVRKGKEGAAHIEKVCKKQGRCQNHSGCSCWWNRPPRLSISNEIWVTTIVDVHGGAVVDERPSVDLKRWRKRWSWRTRRKKRSPLKVFGTTKRRCFWFIRIFFFIFSKSSFRTWTNCCRIWKGKCTNFRMEEGKEQMWTMRSILFVQSINPMAEAFICNFYFSGNYEGSGQAEEKWKKIEA